MFLLYISACMVPYDATVSVFLFVDIYQKYSYTLT